MSAAPNGGHRHLAGDDAEGAAHLYSRSGSLPECDGCASEVRELARYLSTGQLLGRKHAHVPGTPGADAIRALRRRTYPRRALTAVVTTLAPGGMAER